VPRAGIADQNLSGLDVVASAAIGRASVHRVSIIDTSADCIAFNDLDAHDSGDGDV